MASPEDSRPSIQASLIDYKGRQMIRLDFKYDKSIIEEIKTIRGRIWSATYRCWYVPDTIPLRKRFGLHIDFESPENSHLKPTAFDKLAPGIQQQLLVFRKWMEQHRYSEQTIRNYLNHLSQFFVYMGNVDTKEVTADDVVRFNHDVIIKQKLSVSYQRVVTGAIKLFYSHFFDHRMDIERLDRPFREKTLPMVLSKEEVERILKSAPNLKHQAMLSTIYSCGLRRGELLGLKIVDLDKDRNLIRIVQGKGRKDRYVPFSEKLKGMLDKYVLAYNPKVYVFEGQSGGKYSARSIAKVLEYAVSKSGIKKNVTLHTLRHSYATHILDAGTDIRYIQEILGHSSPKTTMIYTHVSSRRIGEIRSPLDDLSI
ncbi:MAG TPA: tyrosine-type recombinase/integrase [Saprospiraceae bacterium]